MEKLKPKSRKEKREKLAKRISEFDQVIKGGKAKSTKSFYKGKAFMDKVKLFKKEKHDFTIQFTGYTAIIKNQTLKRNFLFTKENVKFDFSVTQKIKSEIKSSGVHVDLITTKNVKFFRLNNLHTSFHKEVSNVDINSAYPKALLNLALISESLFGELQSMDKSKKLRAIGQLATKKTVYVFKKGEQVSFYHKVDEQMRNVWFALCNEVGEAINECKEQCKSFLFFWFDGIYFTDASEKDKIMEILSQWNFECKYEVLKDFTVKENEDFVFIEYKKGEEKKQFKLPKSENVSYNG